MERMTAQEDLNAAARLTKALLFESGEDASSRNVEV